MLAELALYLRGNRGQGGFKNLLSKFTQPELAVKPAAERLAALLHLKLPRSPAAAGCGRGGGKAQEGAAGSLRKSQGREKQVPAAALCKRLLLE